MHATDGHITGNHMSITNDDLEDLTRDGIGEKSVTGCVSVWGNMVMKVY